MNITIVFVRGLFNHKNRPVTIKGYAKEHPEIVKEAWSEVAIITLLRGEIARKLSVPVDEIIVS